MKFIFQNIAKTIAEWRLRGTPGKKSGKKFEKQLNEAAVEFNHFFKESGFILLGIIAAAIGLNGFLLPNSFIDGGATGISLILTKVTGVPLSILLIGVNIPFIILGFSAIGKQFALKSLVAIFGLAILVHFISLPTITDDKLLIAVFGGFFLGAGIGLAIRGGAVIDGTEVLAIFLSKKAHVTIGDIILIFNVAIFGVAAYIFTVEVALYAMLTYLSASKTVDFIVSGIEEYVGVTIISDYSEDIRIAIIEKMGRGCTIYNGKRGFGKRGEKLNETDIIYTLITRLELARLHTEIDKIDKNAFLVMHSIKDAKGGMIKKRPLK
ncbi:YitT family protein [Constantimarinum furrinae]|uniref:Membrane protein n=1 Tax=Constantimarinum furrinae TaxID=2562285 RepID=A0A7G8PTJ6_9FLAO|nr:YitT family protein [Constantimarinum furrinae]QNJ97662.1 membrane protein [Constantimarinum furrinae]